MAHTQSVIESKVESRKSKDNNRKSIAIMLLLAVVVSLHAQQWHTTIEITHPAEIVLPDHISELLLVNNTVAHPDAPSGSFYTLMAASESLEGSDYLPSVLETSQNNSASLYRKQQLSNAQADSLMTLYHSDAMAVLNQLIVHPATECFETDNETFYAYTQGIAASHWTLFFHNASNGELRSRTLVYSDTLSWENEAESCAEAVAALPSTDEARNEMYIYAGERFASRFMPAIETADRYLYDLGNGDQGMYYFTRRQWQQAIDAWSQQQPDKKSEAYAAANCAVTYEILGELAQAYMACTNAIACFDALRSSDARQQAVNIRYYQEHLRQRMTK